MGQTGICPILSHGTMGQGGHRDTHIYTYNMHTQHMVNYVPFSYTCMVQWDGIDIGMHTYLHTYIYIYVVNGTDWDMSHSPMVQMGQNGHKNMYVSSKCN